MYFFEKIISDNFDINNNLPSNFDKNSSVFFDIETSGFSPKSSFVFLIGLLFFRDNNIILRQYFAYNLDDEFDILNNFIEDIAGFKDLYNFNGTSFDIPFIVYRLGINSIKYNFENHNIIDIYKILLANKQIISLQSYKLKNIEQHLNIIRKDELSGSQIVSEYKKFAINKNNQSKEKILLHNEEDVINLYRILPILNLINNIKSVNPNDIDDIIIKIDNKINISGTYLLDSDSINISDNNYSFKYNNKTKRFTFTFKIIEGTLYYVFNDYKHYYYFPDIDQAIHKSVAKYYKNESKIQATKLTCYSKISAQYIEVPTFIQSGSLKLCTKNPTIPQNCITIDEIKNNITSNEIKELFKIIVLRTINTSNLK